MSPQSSEPPDAASTTGATLPVTPEAATLDAAQPHILYRLSWLWVLLAGIGAYLLLLRTLLATQNPNFLPSMISFGSMVVPATVLTFATTGGRRRIRVGAGTVAFTAVAGGILGTVAAATLEYDSLRALGALPMLMVGLIEKQQDPRANCGFPDRSTSEVA